MASETFGDIGKIEAIRRLLTESGIPSEAGGALVPGKGSRVCSSSRLFVEGIDFDLTYFPLKHLGYKCVVAVTGELLALMAHPKALSLRLGLSAKLDLEHVRDLWTGVAAAAKEYGFMSVDLDLSPSPNGLLISLSAIGEESGTTLERTKEARTKDLLCISGRLGAAFLGQQVLEREKRKFIQTSDDSSQPELEKYRMLIASYLKPELSPSLVSRFEEEEIYPSRGYLVNHGLGAKGHLGLHVKAWVGKGHQFFS